MQPDKIPPPPDEFGSWIECAIFAVERQPLEYGAPQVHVDQARDVARYATAEFLLLRGSLAKAMADAEPDPLARRRDSK